jgi:hypothetical protein
MIGMSSIGYDPTYLRDGVDPVHTGRPCYRTGSGKSDDVGLDDRTLEA